MVRLFKEDSYDDVLDPKLFMIHDVWEDEVYDVVEKAKSLGIKEEDIDYDGDNQIIKVSYSPYSGMAFHRCANLYNWFINFKDRGREAEFNESVSLKEKEDVDIDVKNPGVLEVPEGKTVDQLPMSHFEKLAKEKGLGKITKALNNLQVWNKNDDPKLSKWAGDMIDKLNKKLKKDENLSVRDAKKIASDEESMGMLDDIAKMQKNRASRTEYEQKDDDKKIKDYVKRINDKLNKKESLSGKIVVKESPMDYLDTTTRSIIDKMEQLGYTGSRKPIMFDGKPMGYWSKTYFTDKRTSSGIEVYIDPFDGSVEVQEFEYDVDTEDLTDICPVKNVVSSNDIIKIDRWAKAAKKHSYSLNYESLGSDRYDPNVEADFIEPGNLYDDMPETEYDTDDTFEFYVSYCMNNCGNEEIAREYLESENLPESFIDSIINEVYLRFDMP